MKNLKYLAENESLKFVKTEKIEELNWGN